MTSQEMDDLAPEIQVGKLTDAGQTRGRNEDALSCHREDLDEGLLARRGRLFVVADGVGGRSGGEVASSHAVQLLQEIYYSHDGEEEILEALKDSIQQVNEALYEMSQNEPSLEEMSTTLVCAAIQGRDLYVANVGDSRAYVICDGVARRITDDHSMAMELARSGQITEEAALSHPFLSVLSRSLGKEVPVEIDTFHEQLHHGEVVLLCSDGLWGQVSEDQLGEIASQPHPQQAAEELVALANRQGGPDNVSVIILRVGEVQTGTEPTRPRAIRRIVDLLARRVNPGSWFSK